MKNLSLSLIVFLFALPVYADISGTVGGVGYSTAGTDLTLDAGTPNLQLRGGTSQASNACSAGPCVYDLATVADYLAVPYSPRVYHIFQDTGGGGSNETDDFEIYACDGGDQVVFVANGVSDCVAGDPPAEGTSTLATTSIATLDDVVFGIGILIMMIAVFLIGFIFNVVFQKNKKHGY